jgi:hypothetical protein
MGGHPILLTRRYCSKEHQQQHYKDHKQDCLATAPIVTDLIKRVKEVKPASYAEIQDIVTEAEVQDRVRYCSSRQVALNIRHTVFCRNLR